MSNLCKLSVVWRNSLGALVVFAPHSHSLSVSKARNVYVYGRRTAADLVELFVPFCTGLACSFLMHREFVMHARITTSTMVGYSQFSFFCVRCLSMSCVADTLLVRTSFALAVQLQFFLVLGFDVSFFGVRVDGPKQRLLP